MATEDDWGLRFPRVAALGDQVVADMVAEKDPVVRAGIGARGALATIPAGYADAASSIVNPVAEYVGTNVIEPAGRFVRGLTAADRMPRTRAPAASTLTPETARPNKVETPVPAPAVISREPDTSKFPYGLDLGKLQRMFPAASNAPAAASNGLESRALEGTVMPRAPQRRNDKDLQRQTQKILSALRGIRTDPGSGFGNLMRYRIGLAAAGRELLPVASERARRNAAHEDEMNTWQAEQALGLKLQDLALSRDRFAADQFAAERAYGLDRFKTQWDMASGLMNIAQAQRAAQAKTQMDAEKALYARIQKAQALDSATGGNYDQFFYPQMTPGGMRMVPLGGAGGLEIDDPTAGVY